MGGGRAVTLSLYFSPFPLYTNYNIIFIDIWKIRNADMGLTVIFFFLFSHLFLPVPHLNSSNKSIVLLRVFLSSLSGH